MAEILSCVSESGTEGTPTNGGSRYTSLQAAVGEQAASAGGGNSVRIECYGFEESGSFAITNAGTDATDFITITAAPGHEHNGVSRDNGGTGYRLTFTTSAGVIRPNSPYVVIENIEVKNEGVGGCITPPTSAGQITLKNIIAKSSTIASSSYIIGISSSGVTHICENLLVESAGRGCTFGSNAPEAIVNNSTIILTGGGSYAVVQGVCKNVVATGAATADFFQERVGCENNASSDSTAPGSNPVTVVSTVDGVDFVSPSTGDYNPQPGGKLDGLGTSPPVTALDIAGNANNDPSDIGAFAIAESSLPTISLTLTDAAGSPATNLTGLKWWWFDDALPSSSSLIVDGQTDGTTDGAGVFTQELSASALTSGQTGWLSVTDSTGSSSFDHKGFSGPVDID